MRRRHLLLMGFPNAGKSFFGKKIARRCNVPFVDIDKEWVSRLKDAHGHEQKELVRENPALYLQLKQQWLKHRLPMLEGQPPSIINTGGNIVYDSFAMDVLGRICFKIYLEVDYPALEARRDLTTKGITFPDGIESYEDLLAQRIPLYEAHADLKFEEAFDWEADLERLLSLVSRHTLIPVTQ